MDLSNFSSSGLISSDHRALSEMPAESVWLANITSANTQESYRRVIRRFVSEMDLRSSDDLYQVTQAHIIAWRESLRDSGMSNASVAQHLSALSSMYKELTDQQLCTYNPVTGVKRPGKGVSGTGSGKTPAMTPRQMRRLIDAPLNYSHKGKNAELYKRRDHAILMVYAYSGARCSEPGSLKMKDIYQDSGYWILRFMVKGDSPHTVAIADAEERDNECLCAVQSYLALCDHANDPDAPLFRPIRKGHDPLQPLSRMSFTKIFSKYRDHVGLDKCFTPHSMRATFITQAFRQGMRGEDIQRSVKHSSITTTETYNQNKVKHENSVSLEMRY